VDYRLHLEALEDRNLMSFSAITSYAAGASPLAVALADFNNDTRLDLAVVNHVGNSVSVLLGKPDGTFGPAVNASTGAGPVSLAVGDFNGDGKLDIATANNTDISVLLGNGDGTMQAALSVVLPGEFPPGYGGGTALPQQPLSVAVGDFDADGNLDLTAGGQTSFQELRTYCGYYGCFSYYATVLNGYANVLLGNGKGSFASSDAKLLSGSYPTSVAVGNFNGDTKPDLAVADSGYATILLGNGDGTLQAPVSSVYTGATSVAVGDINADGNLDLATRNYYNLSVLLGNGDGTLQAAKYNYLGSDPLSVAVGDIKADGHLDLVATSNLFTCTSYGYFGCYDGFTTGYVNVLLGYGDGTFAAPKATTLASPSPYGVGLGNLNGDGLIDVATANQDTNDATVLTNAGDWVLPPKITINDMTVTEGDSGTVDATFTVSLSFPSSQTVTVDYTTAAGTASDGKDYAGVTSPLTLTFAPGEISKPVTIQVKGDLIDEYDEYFYVNLSNPTVGEITDGQGVGTIVDNDPPPTLAINDMSITEGNRGTKLLTFTVTLSALSEKWISVNYATADGTAKTSDHDYQATSGTLWFAPGQTTATFSVVIYGDKRKEPNETFAVNLSAASEATILDGVGIGTILNDDGGGRGNNQH
jgi:hypothetical protein